MKDLAKTFGYFALLAVIVVISTFALMAYYEQDMTTYKRKYPNTTTGDYIWDRIIRDK